MKKTGIVIFLLFLTSTMVFSQSDRRESLRLLNKMMKLKMDKLIPLYFGNALDGKAITGATVEIDNVGTFTTDIDGIISFPQIADGFYSMTVSKEGFITTAVRFQVIISTVMHNRFYVSPVMLNEYFRIVLDWGEKPADLDLHFEKDGAYHISWRNMHSAADGSVILDRDALNGFGPETVTVRKAENQSVYSVYIVNYTNFSNEGSRALSESGAVVKVYSQDRLLHVFTVPQDVVGNRWTVFRIIGGNITPVNTVTYSR